MADYARTGDAVTGAIAAGLEQHGGSQEPAFLGLGASWFVAAAILAALAILLWMKVPGTVGRMLDRRIEAIRDQLSQAARLRAEAEALRDEYQARAAAADAERNTMLERARQQALAIVEQAKVDTAALVERRTRMAEDRLAAAERQAIKEVRARAAAAAAAAASKLIAEELGPDADKAMVDRTIAELGKR